ncbi:MAG: hypothetical protein IT323_08660 [Anaerolineae bacterium]|nr:hypothetical protein [Anaerolineae bacterium]
MSVHLFGIRHHGPGSARSLRAALEQLRPDALLVEGPADGDPMLPLMLHPDLIPPVALLIYAPERPRLAAYYPFAEFSPEWQALRYGLREGIATRFMDFPQTHRLAMLAEEMDAALLGPEAEAGQGNPPPATPPAGQDVHHDPLRWLAEAAGYSDGERWWEHMVEQRRGDDLGLFAAILEAMTALREAAPPSPDRLEPLREAWMRRAIRQAQKEGCQRIAVVCGAWHTPALASLPPAGQDDALLRKLPRLKVEATWVPWSYGRLTFGSGYGAGIESPGWYHHLWEARGDVAAGWMARVARLLRDEDLDASPAQIIDAVRAADTLAALRERPIPGLPEMNDAAQMVFCFGREGPMNLIRQKLIVSERLGDVPDATPMVPLQQDLQREQRRLRLKPEAEARDLTLDLREPLDLERSRLLHRLALLDIEWGKLDELTGREKGTFREYWKLQWQPELSIDLVEASMWGTTIQDAAAAYASGAADSAPDLPSLTVLLGDVILADLPDAARHLIFCLQDQAALASDTGHLMDALPPLVRILRYSDVRQTGLDMVRGVVDGLAARITVGLSGACAALDDDAASAMAVRLSAVHAAFALLQNAEHMATWQAALVQVADRPGVHGLVAGRCHRLLYERGVFSPDETARRFGLALSPASDPLYAAAWLEGFLRGSGTILLHDEPLWRVLDGWVSSLKSETFNALLPLVRRAFTSLDSNERRALGERVRRRRMPDADMATHSGAVLVDAVRGQAALPVVSHLLGVTPLRDGP